jgi:hypothetical protein
LKIHLEVEVALAPVQALPPIVQKNILVDFMLNQNPIVAEY